MNQDAQIEDVLKKLSAPEVARDTITLLTIRLIELRFPGLKVEVIEDEALRICGNSGLSHIMYLGNMLAECQRERDRRAEIVERYVRIIVPHDVDDRVTSLQNIVTLVRDEQYLGIAGDASVLAVEHLIADLWLVLARDDEESVTTLSREDAAALSDNFTDLFRRGIDNAAKLLHGLEAKTHGKCYTLSAENIFHVSPTVAMDFVWEKMTPLVDGDIVLGVPASDTVIFCGSADSRAIEELRQEVEYVTRHGHPLISDTMFRRVEGKWQGFS